jgi:hypothetical protein
MHSCNIVYKGIDISKVLAITLYGRAISNTYKAIFHSNRFDKQQVISDLCVIYSHKRSGRTDYFQIMENLISYTKELAPEFVVMQPKTSLVDKYLLIKQLFLAGACLSKLEGSLLQRLYLFLLVARVRVNIDYIFSFLEKSNIKVVVTFCDAHDIDNIITQCANKLNITTVTLQHGQYCIAKADTAENMALANLTSNYLCAWGPATCDEFRSVDNSFTKTVSLGSLRAEANSNSPYSTKNIVASKTKNIICVMLNADNCLNSNIEMIKIINDFCLLNSYKYCVRFHPKNNQQHYQHFFKKGYYLKYGDVESNAIAFSIIFTSGVMVELLIKGQLFFLYQDETTPELFQQKSLSFTTSEQLMLMCARLYKNIEKGVDELNGIKEYFINTDEVKANYLTFFKDILKNNNK